MCRIQEDKIILESLNYLKMSYRKIIEEAEHLHGLWMKVVLLWLNEEHLKSNKNVYLLLV